MTTEIKENKLTTEIKRKNPDYKASAVNLCQPPEVITLLADYRKQQAQVKELQYQMSACIPQELKDKAEDAVTLLAQIDRDIRDAIDEHGSYQDPESGLYAVKQRKESMLYKPALVKKTLPAGFHALVIEEAVNTRALEGLIKGGLVSVEQAKQCGEVKESFAYIVK